MMGVVEFRRLRLLVVVTVWWNLKVRNLCVGLVVVTYVHVEGVFVRRELMLMHLLMLVIVGFIRVVLRLGLVVIKGLNGLFLVNDVMVWDGVSFVIRLIILLHKVQLFKKPLVFFSDEIELFLHFADSDLEFIFC